MMAFFRTVKYESQGVSIASIASDFGELRLRRVSVEPSSRSVFCARDAAPGPIAPGCNGCPARFATGERRFTNDE